MLTNKQRLQYIQSFRKGGFIGSYINEIKKMLSNESEPEPEQEVQQIIPIQRPEQTTSEVKTNTFIPDMVSRNDSFTPNTLQTSINRNIQPLTNDSIIESEEITRKEKEAKDLIVQEEFLKRSSEELLPITDYVPPPPGQIKSTVPSLNEVGSLQKHIINKGFSVGSSGIDNRMGTNTIKGLQKMLMSEGYDIGQSEGYGADGILGSRTKKAFEDYQSKNMPQFDENVPEQVQYKSPYEQSSKKEGFLDYCEEEQCSQFVQTEMARNTRQPLKKVQQDAGVVGDAWRMVENIRKKGGSLLYDEFTGVENIGNIQEGDIVTMFTGGLSGYQRHATQYTGHKTAPSHAGIVDSPVMEDDKGKYFYVVHNVHTSGTGGQKYQGRKFRNKVYINSGEDGNLSLKVDGFKGFSVKQIASPAFGDSEKISVNPNIKVQASEQLGDNKVVNNMIQAVNSKKTQKKVMFDLGLTEQEYYDIAQAALGLVGQESKYGTVDKVPVVPGKAELLGKEVAAMTYRSAVELTGKDAGETSLGYGRIKYNTNFHDIEGKLKSDYGISKKSLSTALDDGSNSIIATMFALGRRYNDLKRDKSIDDNERMYLAIQRYNRYNLDRPYGSQGKTSREYAKDRDIDYVNKVLNFAENFQVTDGQNKYKTLAKELNKDPRVIERQLKYNNN